MVDRPASDCCVTSSVRCSQGLLLYEYTELYDDNPLEKLLLQTEASKRMSGSSPPSLRSCYFYESIFCIRNTLRHSILQSAKHAWGSEPLAPLFQAEPPPCLFISATAPLIRCTLVRIPERSPKKVPEDKILSVVIVETCVVDSVMCRTIDKRQL